MGAFEKKGTARASAVLPAAGAYDTSPTAICMNTTREVAFLISYTRGGVAGAVTYKIEMTNDGTNWYQCADVMEAAVVAGSDSLNLQQRSAFSYTATGGSAEKFMSQSYVVSATFVRIVFKESGNVGAPGTVFCEYHLKGDI